MAGVLAFGNRYICTRQGATISDGVSEKEAMSVVCSIYISISHLICHRPSGRVFSKLPSLSHYLPGHHLARPSRHVALKVIKKKNVKGNEASVRTEIDLLTGLDHPNIVCLSPLNLLLAESCLTVSSQRASLPSTMLSSSSALFSMPLTTSTATAPSTGTSSTLDFLSLSLFFHPRHRPENILYRSKDPNSDIVIVDFGM